MFCENSCPARTTLSHNMLIEHSEDIQSTSYAKKAVLPSLERQPLENQSSKETQSLWFY